MLMPDKHLKLSESLFGLGAFLLERLGEPKSLDDLWSDVLKGMTSRTIPNRHSIGDVVLALGFLYSIGTIRMFSGKISRCS